ncbi:MAG: hypothetical protein AB7J13_13580 [Pyrinomonadaceae bacterium]
MITFSVLCRVANSGTNQCQWSFEGLLEKALGAAMFATAQTKLSGPNIIGSFI